MPTYPTIDYLPDLTPAEMISAQRLTLTKTTDPTLAQWENSVIFVDAQDYAILHDTFQFTGLKGAAYSIISSSYFDPFLLEVFDSEGNVIVVDDGQLEYGFDHAFFIAPYSGTFYINASWDQGLASSHKAVGVGVFEDLDTIPVAKQNFITGTSGPDRILGTADSDVVNGGDGVDTFVLGRQRSLYSISMENGTVTVTDKEGLSGVDTLRGVERIQFFDATLSFETSGVAPQAYRLYQAAFDRAPDAGGLGYWVNAMERGISLGSVAQMFLTSPEFTSRYGVSASPTDIIAGFYQNVLHRPADAGGFDYWLDAVNNKHVPLADVLVAFSESAENQAQLIGVLQGGFEFSR
jgi:hypothetical protein